MVGRRGGSMDDGLSPLQRRRISFEACLSDLDSDMQALQKKIPDAHDVQHSDAQSREDTGGLAVTEAAPKPQPVTEKTTQADLSLAMPKPQMVTERTMQGVAPPQGGSSLERPVWRVAFEKPENVSRRSSTLTLVSQNIGRTLPSNTRQLAEVDGESKAISRKRLLSPVFERHLEPHLSKKARTGPQRAAARKKYQQSMKMRPSRRVALWRTRIVDGEREVVYVSLGGEALPKSKGYRVAKEDQRYLKAHGIGSFSAKNSAIENPWDLEPYASLRNQDSQSLSFYSIPLVAQAGYQSLGLERLYDWQAACLQVPEVLLGQSLVYTAPTSGGKSLIAELLMMRRCLFQGLRALVILPYVSICNEKVEALQHVWGPCGLRIEAFTGGSKTSFHSGIDVAVCTIEKASSLLNRMLEEKALQRDLGTIVIDEMHLLGDDNRGYLLELILLKIRLTIAKQGGNNIQIIGLSATLPNIETIGKWLGAHVHISQHRPVPLHLFVKSGSKILGPSGDKLGTLPAPRSKDSSHVVALVWDSVKDGHSVLVFCATKPWCEKSATLIAEELSVLRAEVAGSMLPEQAEVDAKKQTARVHLLEELRQCPSGLCPVLAQTVKQGVAYHHAGLTVQERAILEHGFREQILCCLCATSTLAAGVNLPARRVIIRSLKIGNAVLDPVRFQQMAGRAGRAGLDTFGECFLMAEGERDLTLAKSLIGLELTPIKSTLYGSRLARAVLETCSLGLVERESDLSSFFARFVLRFHENGCDSAFCEDLKAAVKYLESLKLLHTAEVRIPCVPLMSTEVDSSSTKSEVIDSDLSAPNMVDSSRDPDRELKACPLGDGVVFSSLSPADGMRVFEDLQHARAGLRLDTDLHLVYLATPVAYGPDPSWSLLLEMYQGLLPRERAVADAVGVKYEFLTRASLRPPDTTRSTDGPRSDREREVMVHRRFWYALMLHDLLLEKPLARVCKRFNVPRGDLQGLQALAAIYCSMVRILCERLRWHDIAAMLASLHPRLSFGASAELLPLCQIPECHTARARALAAAGFDSVEALARAPVGQVEHVLRRLHQFESFNADKTVAVQQEKVVRGAAVRIVQGAQGRISEQVQEAHDDVDEVLEQLQKGEQNVEEDHHLEYAASETNRAGTTEALGSDSAGSGEESVITSSPASSSSEDERDDEWDGVS